MELLPAVPSKKNMHLRQIPTRSLDTVIFETNQVVVQKELITYIFINNSVRILGP